MDGDEKPGLAKAYEPALIEQRTYQSWVDSGVFSAPVDQPGDAYTIVIPPPNITGQLHMGHALNNTVQDILVRWQRKKGKLALWLPGTDHAGIATQAVVERDLAKQGQKRRDMGREKFLEHVWAWRDKYGAAIIGQLEKIGSSCDWSRLRFTLDDGCSKAVRKVFCDLYREGFIYRGEYLVNWCPKDQTALSDEEVEHEDLAGNLYHIRYPGTDGSDGVVVATTRPETMLGDVAVAVHPDDERYRSLVGRTVRLPLVDRDIPVVADGMVDMAFGTGAVKITPAHDPNDFQLGKRHGLTPLNVMNPDGTINAAGGRFAGMDRLVARDAVVAALTELGLLLNVDPHTRPVGHCYRCHSVVEPYLSTQWFVRMKEIAEPALEAVRDGRIKFHPARWSKTYFDWMENIRDWCISRQLWWGHRIPAFYCKVCAQTTVAETDPTTCCKCGSVEITQDGDVLDTWFSSALWPFSTLGWPDQTPDLARFYPTSTLVTDRGIIFFWVARMIMSGLHHLGAIPFTDVYIHGTILDKQGRKMSKSLGNGIDPLDIIKQYGADAMRFSLVMLSSGGQDIKLSVDKFEMGRNFANKLWNAARFILMHVGDAGPSAVPQTSTLSFSDRWILSRLSRAASSVETSLSGFDFYGAASALYSFVWHEFCDWYLELIKPVLYGADAAARAATLTVARHVLDSILGLLHPLMPFLTEELHAHLPGSKGFLARSPWPVCDSAHVDGALEDQMDLVQKVIGAVRRVRAEFATKDNALKPSTELEALIRADPAGRWAPVVQHESLVRALARVGRLEIRPDLEAPPGSASELVDDGEVYVPLEGLIDRKKEEVRLTRELGVKQKQLEGVENKLSQETFISNAPAEIVQKEKDKQDELVAAVRRIEKLLTSLRQSA